MNQFAEKFQAAGVVPADIPVPPPSKKRAKKKGARNWRTSRAENKTTITWSHEIGTVQFSVAGFKLGRTHSVKGTYWAQILVGNHLPAYIDIEFASNLAEGVIPYSAKGSNCVDCGDIPLPTLRVPVKWSRVEGVDVPHTRQKDVDNVDLFLRLPDGEFIDLQVSMLTRGGNFYLCVQEVASGEIIKLPKDAELAPEFNYQQIEVNGNHFVVIPLFQEHLYPGADFLKVTPHAGRTFVLKAVEDGAYAEPDELVAPLWEAPEYPSERGWTIGAVCLWFNPLVGGKVLCADGVECYVPVQTIGSEHHKSAMREGDFPIMVPMQQVLLRYEEGSRGRIAKDLKLIPTGTEVDDE